MIRVSSEFVTEWSPAATETDRVRDASRVLLLFALVSMLGSLVWPRLGACAEHGGLNWIWFGSQVLFAVLMCGAWLAGGYLQACAVVVAAGLCYSVTVVVPV